MANFSLRHLRYFVASVENGGVAQASRQIHRSQPSISVAIKELETAFGVQLFVRHRSSGMTLTPAGHRFYHHAVKLLRHSRDFETNVFEESNIVAGELTVAFFESLAALYAPVLMATFLNRFPAVSMKPQVCSQSRIVEGLRTGLFDVAVCYVQGLPEGIESTALLSDRFPHAVLPRDHRFANSPSVSLAMMSTEPFVLLDIWPSNEYFLGIFETAGLTPNVVYKAPSLELVRGMVGHGLGVSILVSEPVNHQTFDGREIATVPITDAMAPSRVVMAWHGATEMTRASREFLAHCVGQLGGERGTASRASSLEGSAAR
jgi:DNA-binding transcriptional LysR family regulator